MCAEAEKRETFQPNHASARACRRLGKHCAEASKKLRVMKEAPTFVFHQVKKRVAHTCMMVLSASTPNQMTGTFWGDVLQALMGCVVLGERAAFVDGTKFQFHQTFHLTKTLDLG